MERVRIGDYRLEAELTAGPVARTYHATHQVLPRPAIVKIANTPNDSIAVLREACILAALPHPGIVRVYETGRGQDHLTWFASEVVEGLTLASTLALGGALEVNIGVGIVRDLAELLAYAHHRGVVHAGLVPDRVSITPRLRGFGLCINDWTSARTHDSHAIYAWEPSPYMAPEVVRGELDDRADVYALGAIAYRVLTGNVYEGTPLASLASPVPRPIALVIDSMLAHDRWDRPTSAEARAALANPVELDEHPEVPAPHDAPVDLRIRKPRWTPPLVFLPNEAADDSLERAKTVDDLEPPKS